MKIFSEETRRRMSEAAKRRCQTRQFREQVEGYWQPFCTQEDLERDYVELQMSQAEIVSKYGVTLKRVQTSMRRYGIQPRPQRARVRPTGERAFGWKGDAAGYSAFHMRVITLRGRPQHCESCGRTDAGVIYDWANLTGNYPDPTDYQRMCRPCHRRYDDGRRGGAPGYRSDVTPEIVKKLADGGMSINAIAAQLGVSWPTVNHRLRRAQ